ncbi:acyl-CoA dehydrogenase family protein [Ottowia thiooxydans]|uniref:Dibenzothiophene monooxygenase n=1 Tax=Ottowia thiooxydans TaxID=219182 RepID=A0ABV2QCH3_9BURK
MTLTTEAEVPQSSWNQTQGKAEPSTRASAARLETTESQDPWTELFASIARSAAQREDDGRLPHAEVRALLARGFGALHVPRELGGGGLNYRELFALVVRLGAADANIAHIFRNHYAFVNGLLTLADRDQAEHWLRRAAQGDLFAQGVTDAVRPLNADGSVADLSRFSTTLREDEKGQFLDGQKQYATGSVYADWIAVQATSEDGSQAFSVLVSTKAEGVKVIDDWAGFGQRFTGSGTVILEQARLRSKLHLLRRDRLRPGSEYSSSLPQLFLTAVIAGIVQASFDDALQLVKTRKQNLYFAPSPTPTEDPLLLQTLGQLAANAFAARSVILHAAEALDAAAALPVVERSAANQAAALAAAQAKVVIDALGTSSATLLFDIAGASATHRGKQLDRHWRNARTIASHNPSSYKSLAIGAHLARGEPLPKQGFF